MEFETSAQDFSKSPSHILEIEVFEPETFWRQLSGKCIFWQKIMSQAFNRSTFWRPRFWNPRLKRKDGFFSWAITFINEELRSAMALLAGIKGMNVIHLRPTPQNNDEHRKSHSIFSKLQGRNLEGL